MLNLGVPFSEDLIVYGRLPGNSVRSQIDKAPFQARFELLTQLDQLWFRV
jgi:hypothetical protein